jgi:hypothetical protein
MTNEGDMLKRIVSALCAVLFIVATALGIPISESLLEVGQQPQQPKKGGSSMLRISDECEEEIKDIPIYGGVSDACDKELEKLHKLHEKLHRIEALDKEEEEAK